MSDGEPGGIAPVEGVVEGDGVRLHYLDWGRAPQGEVRGGARTPTTALFLHGGGLNAHTWRRTIAELVPGLRCVALDLRGHGDSSWHPDGDYALESHADDVAAVVADLGLTWFVLVGMSLGGAVALTYAGRDPDDLRGLVMIDNGPAGSREEGRRRLGELMAGHQEYPSLDAAVERAMAVIPGRDPERHKRSVARNMRASPSGTWSWKWDPRIRWRAGMTPDEERAFADERSRRLWAAAAAVTCPTLIVRGGASDMFPEADAQRAAAAFADGRLVTIEGAGHTVQSDRPEALAETLRAFIDRETLVAPPDGRDPSATAEEPTIR
jgi:esterase